MQQIPETMKSSPALQFVISRGWEYKVNGEQIELAVCPLCKKNNYGHFYMRINNTTQKNFDGVWACQRCGVSGNLYTLKEKLGLVSPEISSQKDWSASEKKIDPLPDTEACHQALLQDADALDYFINFRGFSREIIERQKLGIKDKVYFRGVGEVKAIVYPYLVNGNTVWCHYRTLPDINDLKKVPKAFSSPAGWDSTLYNGEVLKDGLKEVILVEGECNTIAAMDKGIENICGVPGANIKKAEWIDTLDKIGVERIYICYDRDKVGQRAAQVIASRIGIEKCWKIVLPEFNVIPEDGVERKGKDLNEWFTHGGTAEEFEQLKQDATLFDVDGVTSAGDAIDEFVDSLESKGAQQKYVYPLFSSIAQFDEGDCCDILGEEKSGKLLSNDSKILMEDGTWKLNGDMQVGDRVASVDGQENIVTGVFPQGEVDLFKVTFWDGRWVLAGSEHLWKIGWSGRPQWGEHIFTTDAICTAYNKGTGSVNADIFIPTIDGKFNKDIQLPVDPYLLGALIGDGSIDADGTAILHARDEDIYAYIESKGVFVNRLKNRASFPDNKPLKDYMIECGLAGTICETKFIPKLYLQASYQQRLELLRGLMDTDGTAGNRYGTPSYTTVSPQLAEDFQYLVRSLGGICKQNKLQKKTFKYKGEKRRGQPAYIFTPRINNREDLFILKRKADRAIPRKHFPRLTFKSIEPWGKGEATCISVSHPSKLYVTNDFIVTHNTTLGLCMMDYMVETYGENGLVVCLEMTRAKLARKCVSRWAGIPDNLPQTKEEADALTRTFKNAIPSVKSMLANREGDLLLCYPKYSSADDIYKLIIDCIRRYGVKWIMLDNLQRLCDTTLGGKNRTQYLSEISKRLSQICKDYNVQMIRILQPHQIGIGRIVSTRDVDGASQIAKDCDIMFTIHRNRIGEVTKDEIERGGFIETNGSFGPEMYVSAGISRYSSGGSTQIYYDGATSSVFPMAQGKINEMNRKAAVGYQAQIEQQNLSAKLPDDIRV